MKSSDKSMECSIACRIEWSLVVIPADQSPTDLNTYIIIVHKSNTYLYMLASKAY